MRQGGSDRRASDFRNRVLAALVLLGAFAFTGATANAAGPTACTGTENSASLHSDVVVPNGQTCVLVESVVVGNVVVNAGGTLVLQGSAITGSVRSDYGAVSLEPDEHGDRTTVSGSLKAVGGGPVTLLSAKVDGNASISHEPAGGSPNTVCSSTIGGNLTVQGNYTQSIVGDPSVCGADAGDQITGNVLLLSNTAMGTPAVLVSDNTVGGNLRCKKNRGPAFSLAGTNDVSGKSFGECAASSGGTRTECSPEAEGSCSGFGRSLDESGQMTVTTGTPSSGNEHILISFGGPSIGCTSAGTGTVATFYVTDPGPGYKEVSFESLGGAAETAEAEHPIEWVGEASFGYACYESPTSFTTYSGAPATPGPNGFYGQLPSCQVEDPPCVAFAGFYYGDTPSEDTYYTQIATPQADPRLSH